MTYLISKHTQNTATLVTQGHRYWCHTIPCLLFHICVLW